MYAGIATIILGALGQGLLISTVTDSQQVAFMIAVFSSLLPSFLLSGFVFPVSSMPSSLAGALEHRGDEILPGGRPRASC